ncbi:IclR family transcriptional regulator, partial [Actinomadura roseirufa]|uniref:IclR family transcriptional regulator n=1 Tax=Actinomadura roseirufa TaxID=2094049 RepID=UPI001A9552C7
MSEHPSAGPRRDVGTEVAGRVADVLLLFAGGPRYLGVSAIGRELGLSKAVVHRILRSLASRGMLETDPGAAGYRLGPAAVALGVSALRGFDVRAAAAPVLRRLRDDTGETAALSGLVGDERVYLDQFESPREVKMTVEVGRRFPLRAGAPGLAILAFLPAERREAVLTRPAPAPAGGG